MVQIVKHPAADSRFMRSFGLMEPTIDSLLDAPLEHAARIRAALVAVLPGDPATLLETALERLSTWHHEVEAVGEKIEAMIREIDTTTERFVRASILALREDGADGAEYGAMLSQAMELAWLAGGSAGDVPAVTGERLRQSLLDAQRSLDAAGDVVKRFRHGADHARVLARPAAVEPAVRDAAKLLLATRRAGRVRKVISEAVRRGWMRAIAEGSQRELLLTALVLMETGEVTDRELAERFARQGLLRDRQVARGSGAGSNNAASTSGANGTNGAVAPSAASVASGATRASPSGSGAASGTSTSAPAAAGSVTSAVAASVGSGISGASDARVPSPRLGTVS